MIADIEGWRKWEAEHMAASPSDYERNLRWFEAAVEHARALGVWPPADPMEGFEEKLAYVHRLHAMPQAPTP
ncbi:MAG: hypothetical protein ACRD0Y_14540 [Terriglobales bacterium]